MDPKEAHASAWPERGIDAADALTVAQAAIGLLLGLDCQPAVHHQPDFTSACITPKADQAVVDGALAMAWTSIDLATDPHQRERLLNR